jgi:hypothetical protein
MADPSVYSYPSPLEGWEGPALPEEKAADGKSELRLIFTEFPNSKTNVQGYQKQMFLIMGEIQVT